MKRTVLYSEHVDLGAKIVEYAGFEMPVQYSGINNEHLVVRDKVGLFDVSHMGEFSVKGEKALSLIQKITCNDASKLKEGTIQYSVLLNEQGGAVDDLLIYKIKDNDYFLVVNAANIEKDWSWINENNTEGAILQNLSNELGLLALQGPKAIEVLKKLTNVDLESLAYYTFTYGTVAGIEDVLISNTGYTGSGGFELYALSSQIKKLWAAILESGKEEGILPCGLAARDTLRLEKGFCLYGNELTDTITPLEAGLGWITKLDKGEFVGKYILEKQKAEGITKKLIGFEMIDRGIPRHEYKVFNTIGDKIGIVTSGTMSPIKKVGIGIAYVQPEYSKIDSDIYIEIRDKKLKAKIVKMPFV